ncbi:MAG: zf-HC2 domain-containing protein [Lachnospiraceae bacterium]|nr:zf-HC2 domain-containing protein [Lachnospiraceae bacterium]MBP5298062.1 zf-HC2 domain-containing protein [Lachnospiraceae bacterium]
MKYDCDMIEDLLPLYKDGACSEASKKAVEEHLKECPKCQKMLEELSDTAIDEMIVKEKDSIIDSQSRFFKRKSATVGGVIAAIFAVPILVCLIVNLATGHALTWFFIVLAAMLIPTSLIVVPLMARENRMFYTMTSFTGSLLLLLGVISIYTKASWFFVAASSVLFGLTLCFGPFIACRRPVNALLKNFKGLTVMAASTVTFFIMIMCIGFMVKSAGFFPIALSISVPLVMLAWAVFVVIRYIGSNSLVKIGVCTALISAFSYWGVELIVGLLIRFANIEEAIYSMWNMGYAIVGVVIGAALTVIGLIAGGKGDKKNENN